jgi:acyl dehydratase
MIKADSDILIGQEIEPRSYEISQEKINAYSRYVFFGKDMKNIHTDDETARRAGLPGAIAQGRYPVGYLSEYLLAFFGTGWIQGGKLEVSMIKPIFPGDRITLRGKIKEKVREGKAVRLIADVWIENKKGDQTTVGIASGLVLEGEKKNG